MNTPWQDKLRDRMLHHEEPVPEGLWERIEQIMSVESAAKTVPARRKVFPLWSLRVGAAVAAALVLFFIGLHTLNLKENRKEIPMAEQGQNAYPIPDRSPFKQGPAKKTEKELLAYRTEKKNRERVKASHPEKDSTLAIIVVENRPLEKEQQQQQKKEPDTPDEAQNPDPANENRNWLGAERNTTSVFQLPAHIRHRKPAKWQTGIYASNISSALRKHEGYGSFKSYDFTSEEEEYVAAAIRSDLPEGNSILNEYEHVYSDIEHHQPITLGVSLKYNLDARWSLTSGLTYTILSSRLRSGADNHYYNSRQTLHYAGIPLNVNYTVWGNDKVLTYVSAGGLVEKNVSGTLSTDVVIDNKLKTQNSQKISVKPPQWSVNSAVGIQYQFYKNIGIYAEPGVAYYFKNKNNVETIYKEKPLNFNIRLGLRFSLNE
ncbi:outer membrane beta-barrel protein [Proteiniphilum sp. X52]|uniref:outer membrane beta-barrel protein n=1 Tax=Proteiniphilum sp. X52 TaxID=2382159 RepID=UPI000F09CD27|nr:outer membrane beta-barrel protein [Proteiniphilum sp. X52]RNC67040.1 porin family protein [Proteiniphilum sp. X52]